MASIFVNTGKAQEALAIYERILPDAQRLAVLKPNDPKLLSQEAAIHSRMINILRGRNNTQALAHAREQVRLIEPLAKRFPQFALKQELSTGYSQLAAMIGEDEDQSQAAHYYELSLQIREGLLAEQPQNTVVRRGLIIAYGNYASHLASPWATNIGHPDKALVYLDKAVTLARELVSADPQNATAQHDLAAILIRRGTMVGTQRTEQESLKELDEAINLLDTQMKRSGSNPRIIGQITLAREYAGRLLTNMRQYSNAELYLRKSLEQSLALRQTDPGSNAAATQAVASAQALAELLAHKGEAAAATEFAQNSIQIANEVLAANPISNTAKMQLSKCWVAMARVKQLLGDKAASKEAAKRAIIIWKTVSDPGFIRVQQKFIRELEQLIDDPK